VGPVCERLTRSDYDDLVSTLALVIGWEAFIVLLDVHGLSVSARGPRCDVAAAEAILDAPGEGRPELRTDLITGPRGRGDGEVPRRRPTWAGDTSRVRRNDARVTPSPPAKHRHPIRERVGCRRSRI